LRTHGSRAPKRANTRPRGAAALPARIVAVVCWAQALAGCAAGLAAPPVQQIAKPPSVRALLTAPAKPNCAFPEIALGDTWPDPAETARHKLEFERRCYRQAEMQVRERLRRLQASVSKGMKPATIARCGIFCLQCTRRW
jgi:hypothetical protein